MAEYLVLIYGDEQQINAAGKPLFDQLMAEHNMFGENNGPALRGGNALQPVDTGASIRKSGEGTPIVTDGPFAETKEAVAGYYLVEANDLEQAIEIAKLVPAPFGGVEVRPVVVFD